MSEAKYYTIESQSRFHIHFVEVENLEDAADFMTKDEVREMMGVAEGERFYIYSSPMVFKDRVVELLSHLKAEMIRLNKKSMIIADTEFVDFIKTDHHSVSDYVKGLRRVGNRLSLHAEKDKTEQVNKRTAQDFAYAGARCISNLLNLDVEIKYVHQNYVGAIELVKKLLTLEQFVEYLSKSEYYKPRLEAFKKVWENPSQFAPKEVDSK